MSSGKKGKDKKPRIEHRFFKELCNIAKKRKKKSKELKEWKEKICDLPEVDCYPDQLMEFIGQIIGDDCVYDIDRFGNRVRLSGTVTRLGRDHFKEASKYRDELMVIDEEFEDKLEEIANRYGVYSSDINVENGEITKSEVMMAPSVPDSGGDDENQLLDLE
jgi:hypothetical protein